jgi:metacaspase-1
MAQSAANIQGVPMTDQNAGDQLTDLVEQLQQLASQIQACAVALAGASPRAAGAASRSATAGGRHLVYVHGICRHDPGFSDPWWESLHPFTDAFGDGARDDTRHEVVWSDLVNVAGMGAAAVGPAASEKAEWASRIRGVLEERAAVHVSDAGPSIASPDLARDFLAKNFSSRPLLTSNASAAAAFTVPGINCVDDFTSYMFDSAIRSAIIARFTGVVQPLLAGGAELDVISHSWGTVVAYEGLRALEDAGVPQMRARNFFTVGAALSIFLVKLRLLPGNRDGHRPALVKRWINLNATGDPVGGGLQGKPYQVDAEFLNLPNLGCGIFDAGCAHGSYFQPANVAVNRDIFADFINRP